jgi:uncharacterized protein (TIGR01319 family)
VFLRHVIGGTKLSRGPRLGRLVRGATPDLVLAGVEFLADTGSAPDLLLVDVGGATTDVYSVLTPDAERSSGPGRDVVGTLWRSRTVEGDLGVRWNAPGVVAAARAEKLLDVAAAAALDGPAAARAADPGIVARDGVDPVLARLAATVAVRRHARGEPAAGGGPRRGGKDLADVGLLVGSGGVLRHASPDTAGDILAAVLSDHGGGWRVPRAATARVDTAYVIAAAGLLAADHPVAAAGLLQSQLYSA